MICKVRISPWASFFLYLPNTTDMDISHVETAMVTQLQNIVGSSWCTTVSHVLFQFPWLIAPTNWLIWTLTLTLAHKHTTSHLCRKLLNLYRPFAALRLHARLVGMFPLDHMQFDLIVSTQGHTKQPMALSMFPSSFLSRFPPTSDSPKVETSTAVFFLKQTTDTFRQQRAFYPPACHTNPKVVQSNPQRAVILRPGSLRWAGQAADGHIRLV